MKKKLSASTEPLTNEPINGSGKITSKNLKLVNNQSKKANKKMTNCHYQQINVENDEQVKQLKVKPSKCIIM